MLVLSRKLNDTIVIRCGGEVIEVRVVEIKGDKVRRGVQAAREIAVNRGEIDEALYGHDRKEV